MIARMWRGWADAKGAAVYEAHFTEEVQPTLRDVPGCHGGYLLRKEDGESIELDTIVAAP